MKGQVKEYVLIPRATYGNFENILQASQVKWWIAGVPDWRLGIDNDSVRDDTNDCRIIIEWSGLLG